MIERVNACDLLWELGRHDEAAQKLAEVLEALKRRPASDFELVETLSEQIGVLGESGRIDEAVAAARAALPVMRCMPKFRFEPYAQLLWRLGRPEAAARVLGALAAREREGREARADQRGADRGGDGGGAADDRCRTSGWLRRWRSGEGLSWLDVCALLADAVLAPAPQARDSTGRPSVDVVS